MNSVWNIKKELHFMKKNKKEPYQKSRSNKFNIPQNAKGYPIKRVAFHRKVGKNN